MHNESWEALRRNMYRTGKMLGPNGEGEDAFYEFYGGDTRESVPRAVRTKISQGLTELRALVGPLRTSNLRLRPGRP